MLAYINSTYGRLVAMEFTPSLKHQITVLATIILTTLLTYSNIWGNQFVWDDHSFILEWPETRQFWNHIPDFFQGQVPLEHQGLYRPLRSIYYGLAYFFWGINPLGYHALSLVVHILGSWLSYALIRKLWPKQFWLAWLTALVFVVHPIHVEAVAWITPTFDIIGVLLSGLAIYAYISFRQSKRRLWLLVALICASLAYFSNEITLVTAGIMALYDLLLYRPLKSLKPAKLIKYAKTHAGYWLLLLAPTLPYLYIRFILLDIGARQNYLFASVYTTLITMSVAAVKQLWVGLVPWPLTVNHRLLPGINGLHYHEVDIINLPPRPQILDLPILLSLIVLASLAYLAWKYRQRQPVAVFLLSWHALAVLPLMQLVPQSIIFGERYLYLASFGTIPLLIYLIDLGIKRIVASSSLKLARSVFFGGVIIGFGALSYQRNFDWASDLTLWQATLDTGPETPYALNNLAKHYYEQGDINKALSLLERSYQLNPNEVIAVSNLGVLYNRLDRLDESIAIHEHVLEINPGYAPNYEKYASALLKSGRQDEAYVWYEKYLEAYPQSPVAHLKLGQAFHNSFQFSAAVEAYQKTIEKFPYYLEGYYYLAQVYLDMGDQQQATAQIEILKAKGQELYNQSLDIAELEDQLEQLRQTQAAQAE